MVAGAPIPEFLFYLVDALGRSFYVENGYLRRSGILRPLTWAPDGWEDMAIGWERNLQKFGLIRGFSISFGFLGDGAQILEKIFNDKTLDEPVWLVIQRLELEITVDDYALTHKLYYKGEIDLSTYRKPRRKVTVNIMEGGRHKDIKANENSTYETALSTDPEAIRVKMVGLKYSQSGRFIVPAFTSLDTTQYFLPLALIGRDAASSNQVLMKSTDWGFYGGGPAYNFSLSSNNFFYTPIARQVRIHGSIKVTVTNGIDFMIAGSSNTAINPFDYPAEPGLYYREIHAGAGTFTMPFDVTVDLPAGEKLYAYVTHIGATDDIYEETEINVDFDFKYRDTFTKAFKAIDIYKRQVEHISGSRDYAVSTLLEGSSLCYTCGDAVRELDNAFIKTSFKALTDDITIRKCAGLGVEGKNIVLESRQHFMDDDVEIDLGVVKDLEIEVATDVIFNLLKVGYNDPKIEDANGRYAFNVLQEFSTPVKRISKTLELVCPFPADPYYIEDIRINLAGKTTTDASSDNETIPLIVDLDNPQVDDDGVYYLLKREAYTSVDGLPYPDDAYNIAESTPARIREAWEAYMRGCLYSYEGGKLKFETSTKNKDLATYGGPGGDYVESASKVIGAMAAPFFKNRKLTVTAKTQRSIYTTLRDFPRACFKFTDPETGVELRGYLLKCSIICKTNKEQKFIFLSHQDNDLKLLENG